ncbi:hypothetical protein F2P81_013645 [Scophthalmus maximus]|uniref:Serine/threonine-protein phosphatase n=9 Tax=Percomorphaceae TaxID=1489872 RepID=A0A6A4SLW0_SCOMX|nr:hypothetical protein F2P81_013645 [Scophthalmus maximus]
MIELNKGRRGSISNNYQRKHRRLSPRTRPQNESGRTAHGEPTCRRGRRSREKGRVNVKQEEIDEMLKEAPGPINFTVFLTMFGEKLKGADPEETILNAFKVFDPEGKGALKKDFVTMADVDKLNIDSIIQRLLEVRGARPGKNVQLQENEIRGLCLKSREIFLSQPILLELEAPLKICGDIHGQYYDLLRLFEYGGFPPESNYLFLGDYVDRGKQSLETICLLLAYKIKYPENFFLLRGNHECASINRIYGFYDECKRRYNIKLWKTFTDCFNCLPIAAIVDEKIFCCHGGLSPDLQSMEQIRRIMRPTDVPDQGLLCDLLWSDPDKDVLGWGENDRGVSFTFGSEVVAKFLHKHDLDLICRAHQVVEDGYEFFAKRQLVTLFSAPNYCGEFDNAGAMMSVDETLMCSFQILKPAEKKKPNGSRPVTPPRNMVTKQAKK